MGAEYRGRDPQRGRSTLPRHITWSVVTSALLQLARGFRGDAGASLLLFLLTQVAAAFGHVLYVLQRDHVQALVKRRTLLASFRKAAGITTPAPN